MLNPAVIKVFKSSILKLKSNILCIFSRNEVEYSFKISFYSKIIFDFSKKILL